MDKGVVINEVTLDFSPLLAEGKRFAVYCETEEEALIFLRCYRELYPERCNTWKDDDTHFGRYDKHCYRPNLNMPAGYGLKYCSYEYYEDEGFTIIPFSDLVVLPDIEERKRVVCGRSVRRCGMTDIKLNIEFLLKNTATAVHCATEDEARLFMAYLKAHYPNQCARWDVDETRFDECENGIGYTFYWNDGHRWRKDQLMFGSIESIRGDNYTVVDLCELMEEEKELAESDQPVESLFGGLM